MKIIGPRCNVGNADVTALEINLITCRAAIWFLM